MNFEHNLIIGIGCSAHNAIQVLLNNTLYLSICIILYQSFFNIFIFNKIYTVHTLKEFCSFVNTEYKTILGHTKSCWLTLHPAIITRLIEMFDGLESYFF